VNLRKSSWWILVLGMIVGAMAGWYWGASEVAAIAAALRARGETGDQYSILAPTFSAFGLVLGALVGFSVIGIRRVI
jgi:hypothetical protein